MLCSAAELELSEDHDGIIELPDDAPVGVAYARYAELDDPVIDVAVTPNRPDATGVAGIARDLAAAGLGKLKTPAPKSYEGVFDCPTHVHLDLAPADKHLCPAFALRLVRGVTNGPSPEYGISDIGLKHGLTAVCPPTRVLSFFGDKLGLLEAGGKLGISNLVLDFTPIQGIREIERLARTGEFPLILKSARGTGSQGIQVLRDPSDLERRLPLWLEQVRLNLGEVFLFAERHVDGARQVLQPFARFADGRTELFPTVDASLQCRHRKIVEFCPAASLDPKSERQLGEWTRQLAQASGYIGVGVLEFLVDGPRAYLVDGSARLQLLEFSLWVAGSRYERGRVATRCARGQSKGPSPAFSTQAPMVYGSPLRLYAEDSLLQLPQPGEVYELGEQRGWAFAGSEAELSFQVSSVLASDQAIMGWSGRSWSAHVTASRRSRWRAGC